MRTTKPVAMGFAASVALFAAGACSPPPHQGVERVVIPAPGVQDGRRYEPVGPRPLPDDATFSSRVVRELPPPPFDDAPLVGQRAPEQGRFEQLYRSVGRPRIAVFVNRTPDGAAGPTGAGYVERSTVGRRGDGYSTETERTHVRGDGYDEAYARALDYEAIENILTDFMACGGAVEIISPGMVRQRLTAEQLRDLQAGQPRALRDVAAALEADVLIQVSARPTRQTTTGQELRMVGEAVNIKGGQQIGRAMVDMPLPMEKTTVNRYARWVGRKLMADMAATWSSTEPARPDGGRSEPARPEAPRTEPAKPEAPKTEPGTLEGPKVELPRG
ncbi:MAG TPA: hypothetical protein VEA69_05450 [Tepidisphaeraceae bacterium]|nr:hypothetical protein [Tepidisphaeraceae bacterium]